MQTAIERLESFSVLDFLLFIKAKIFVALFGGVVFALIFGGEALFSGQEISTSEASYRVERSLFPTNILTNSLVSNYAFKQNFLRAKLNDVASTYPGVSVEKLDAALFKIVLLSENKDEALVIIEAVTNDVKVLFDDLEQVYITADSQIQKIKAKKKNWLGPYRELRLATFGEVKVSSNNEVKVKINTTLSISLLAGIAGILIVYMLFGLIALIRLLAQYESDLQKEVKE